MNGIASTLPENDRKESKSDIRFKGLPPGWIKLNVGGKVCRFIYNSYDM